MNRIKEYSITAKAGFIRRHMRTVIVVCVLLLVVAILVLFVQNRKYLTYRNAFPGKPPEAIRGFSQLLKDTGKVSKVEYLETRRQPTELEIRISLNNELSESEIKDLVLDTILPEFAENNDVFRYLVYKSPHNIHLLFMYSGKEVFTCGSSLQGFMPYEYWGWEGSTYYLQDFRGDVLVKQNNDNYPGIISEESGITQQDLLNVYAADERIRYYDSLNHILYMYDVTEEEKSTIRRKVKQYINVMIQDVLVFTREETEILIENVSLSDCLNELLESTKVSTVTENVDMNSEMRIRFELKERITDQQIDELAELYVFPFLSEKKGFLERLMDEKTIDVVFLEFCYEKETIGYFHTTRQDSFLIWRRLWYKNCQKWEYSLSDYT